MKKLLFALVFPIVSFSQSFNIKDYGAIADGKTINTAPIQKAIDACNSKGGGTVVVPTGTFISGTLFLKSHVNLEVQQGGILKGSNNLADYEVEGKKYGLIYASDCENISLTGEGEINGNGSFFMNFNRIHNFIDYDRKYIRQGESFLANETIIGDGPVAYVARPSMMIMIFHSERVKIKDLHLVDTPEWNIRLSECENVQCTGLTIRSNLSIPNSDGIHCTTSRNVIISNCDIQGGDDAIIVSGFGDESGVGGYTEKVVVKSYQFGNKTKIAENVTVTNCILLSRSAAIRIGYGFNSIRNLIFSNLIIYNSNRGIGIFCRDDARIENISFTDIHIECRLHTGKWWGRGEPIHISSVRQSGTKKLGGISRIRFSNIRINQAEAGIVVFGSEDSKIEDIDFQDIDLTLQNGPLVESYGGNFDMRPSSDKSTALFKHDIPAFHARQVKNLSIKNYRLKWKDSIPATYFTNGFYAENFENINLEKIKIAGAKKDIPAIFLRSGRGLSIDNSAVLSGLKINK